MGGSTDTDEARTAYDVVVVGSGFGGSVTALRLAEKGYAVAVLEAGRRFEDADFARTSWDLRRFLWAPALGCYGIQRIHLLRDCMVLAGAGVGGGSLNYANTLYRPGAAFFADSQWAGITDWERELAPYYDQAARMLGVVRNPEVTPADEVMRSVAQDMGVGETFTLAPVGVFFGAPGQRVADPFFGGAGPDRTGCLQCGECMTGCRYGAKNTLVKNYLALAERAGVHVIPMTTVTALAEQDQGWQVTTRHTDGWSRRAGATYTARYVVLAAGTWGTQRLLHAMADNGTLPRLSRRLGELTRTNSESIVGATTRRVEPGTDLTRGVAITSSFYPSPSTHVEPVRYGKGSNAMGLLQKLMTDGTGRGPRWLRFVGAALRSPGDLVRTAIVHRWSERSVIALVMQDLDNSITTYVTRGLLGRRRMTSRQGHGIPNPTWIPQANDVARRIARRIGGIAAGSWGEVADIPLTAHFLGGCVIGADAERGVIDPYHRVHGYPGLSIVDGSAVSANLGVNPSLTITAQAERAAALWPNKGELDPRPAPGEAYQPVAPVPPRSPVVPASAPGALRLPLVRITSGRCE